MGYIGAEPATSFETVRKDRFTSQTGTTVTLSHTVSSINDIVVWVNSVKQDYTNYSVSGTTLTLGGSLVSADIVEVAYIGRTFQTVAPDTNMVTNAMMADDSIDSAEIVDGSVDAAHMSANSIDSDAYVDGSIDNAHLADDAVGVAELSATGTASSSTFLRGDNSWAAAGGGKIGQVLQATKTDTTSTTSTSFVDVTGMTIDITPAATSSKILVLVNANMCGSAADWFGHMKLVRDSTAILIGDAASNRQRDSALWRSKTEQNLRNLTPMYLDSPSSTSATTYKLQWAVESGMTFYLNRTGADTDNTAFGRTASSITVMEVLA